MNSITLRCIVLLQLSAPSASAATLTFTYDGPRPGTSALQTYTESNFTLSNPTMFVVDSQMNLMVGNNSDFLFFNPPEGALRLTNSLGLPFTLKDLLIGPLGPNGRPYEPTTTFHLLGYLVGGELISATFHNVTSSTLATLNWSNLTAVDISAPGSGPVPQGVDNINVFAVPEPSTPLLATIFVVFALCCRLRRVTIAS